MSLTSTLTESAVNLVSEGTRVEGKVRFDSVTRVHGVLVGDVEATPGSTLIVGETGVIEGNVRADRLLIDGFIQGEVRATTQVVISGTGRVVGDIRTPKLTIDFGAYFEGRCLMDDAAKTSETAPTSTSPSPRPA